MYYNYNLRENLIHSPLNVPLLPCLYPLKYSSLLNPVGVKIGLHYTLQKSILHIIEKKKVFLITLFEKHGGVKLNVTNLHFLVF